MLHTINKSPFERISLERCLECAKPGSNVLLIEDGVYGALSGSVIADKVRKAMANITICVLESDVKSRGIADKMISGIKLVDYAGFVDLAAESDKVQSWL